MVQVLNFRAQAERCRAEAETATLDNVREQCLRAEAAWLEMAQRHERVANARIAREARPANADDPQGILDTLPEDR